MTKAGSWFCAAALLAGVAGTAGAQTQTPPTRALLQEFQQAFIDLSAKMRPSVVEISAEVPISDDERAQMRDLFRFFDQPDGEGQEGAPEDSPHDPNNMPEHGPSATASGFIYDAQGHIVTNNHVVKGARKIEVQLSDGQVIPATVVGQDADADIAVIKIDTTGLDLRPVDLGDSDALQVGQFAIAMGSPNGLTGSFSYGHVTGLGRESLELPGDGLRFQHFIQTDAAINLGNSGGPLCDIDGNVIGVNVAIVYRANSIGFAIPSNRVREVVPQLIEHGKMIRGWLGVAVRDLQEAALQENIELQEFIEANKLPDKHGSFVAGLTPEGPAEKGKILEDDVIREINGRRIEKSTDLIDTVSAIQPGDTAHITVWRRGEPVKFDVVVGEYPGQMAALFGPAYLGMHVDTLELNPDFMKEREMNEQPSDFYIAAVVDGSPADQAGIRRGDLVVEVGYKEVKTLAAFKKALAAEAKSGKALLLKVWTLSDKEPRKVFVKVPDDFKLD